MLLATALLLGGLSGLALVLGGVAGVLFFACAALLVRPRLDALVLGAAATVFGIWLRSATESGTTPLTRTATAVAGAVAVVALARLLLSRRRAAVG